MYDDHPLGRDGDPLSDIAPVGRVPPQSDASQYLTGPDADGRRRRNHGAPETRESRFEPRSQRPTARRRHEPFERFARRSSAWRDFCRRTSTPKLGERRAAATTSPTRLPTDGPEAIAHLADQVSCWLGFVDRAHATRPAPFFHRSNDLVTRSGAVRTRTTPIITRTHRPQASLPRPRTHALAAKKFVHDLASVGFMHHARSGARKRDGHFDSDRGIAKGDSFEILLGGDGSDPDWVRDPGRA